MKLSHLVLGLSILGLSSIAAAQGTTLGLGQSLTTGQYLTTPAGDRTGCLFRATMQADGYFALKNGTTNVWSRPTTAPLAGSKLTLQTSGDLVFVSPTVS